MNGEFFLLYHSFFSFLFLILFLKYYSGYFVPKEITTTTMKSARTSWSSDTATVLQITSITTFFALKELPAFSFVN